MKIYSLKSFFIALLLAFLVMPPGVAGQKQPPAPLPEQPKEEKKSPEVPDLSELVLQGNKLSSRLAVLETKPAYGLDEKVLEKRLQQIEARLS